MPPTLSSNLQGFRCEIANLFEAADHDVELASLRIGSDGSLHARTTLRSTARTSNAQGTMYGNSLFTLGDLTSRMALFSGLLDVMQEHRSPVVCITRGGTISYLQAATGDISCTLTLPATVMHSIRSDLAIQRRATHTISVDMHNADGRRVAQATLTISARRVRERAAQRLPIIAKMATRLHTLLAPRRSYAM